MMTLAIVQDLFEKVKQDTKLEDLYERKLSVQQQLSEVHKKLHEVSGDFGNQREPEVSRNDLKSVINAANVLLEFIDERIGMVRDQMYEQKKEERIRRAKERDASQTPKKDHLEKMKFFLAARKMLGDREFEAILRIARESTQEEIQAMPQRAIVV